mmetsp:Transcript_24146/g.44899  ORF Transcript_24146/g.44899 Transcript_24146/m.44899 type:complete len:256 (+) Transcript_24146:851-1618(+)
MTQAQNPVDVQRHLAQANSFGSNNTYDSFFSMAIDDDNLLDCFIHLPAQQGVPFQMDFKTISEAQLQDAALLQEAHANPQKLSQQLLAPNTQVYCYTAQPGGSWKIYLPTGLLKDAVKWYHLSLGHVGVSRLVDTLRMHFYHPRLKEVCMAEVKKCDPCQRLKAVGRGHGETATREATLLPWQDVAVDLIGPWTLSIGNRKLKFSALTITDMVTNLTEVVRVNLIFAVNSTGYTTADTSREEVNLLCVNSIESSA